MSATYTFRDAAGDVLRSSPFGKPPPPHTMTSAAEQAREAVRRFAYDRGLRREIAALVTDHGTPHVEPYSGTRPAAATLLAKRAAAKGFTVNVFETPVRTVVEGFNDPYAFRATWLRGRAESATWHERAWRYTLVTDERPVGVAETSRLALAGKRGAGLDSVHLKCTASPIGIPVGITEVTKRLAEL